MRCGTRSPRTCSSAAPTCALSRSCSATCSSRRRSATRTSTPPSCWMSTARLIRGRKLEASWRRRARGKAGRRDGWEKTGRRGREDVEKTELTVLQEKRRNRDERSVFVFCADDPYTAGSVSGCSIGRRASRADSRDAREHRDKPHIKTRSGLSLCSLASRQPPAAAQSNGPPFVSVAPFLLLNRYLRTLRCLERWCEKRDARRISARGERGW